MSGDVEYLDLASPYSLAQKNFINQGTPGVGSGAYV